MNSGDTRRKWQAATLVKSRVVAENVESLVFSIPEWSRHEPGQHYDIRLTAPNGYMAERSYSIATPPEDEGVVEFGVQLLENGEVSPYLFSLKEGGQVEIRGPIGGHFIWNTKMPGPLYLIGGGSGMVPLMSMLRHHMKNLSQDSSREIIFLISARSAERVLYKEELKEIESKDPNVKIIWTLTDEQPEGFKGYTRRIDESMIKEIFGDGVVKMPMIYICGPTPFVEAAAKHLVGVGFNPHEIKTERFGG